MMDITDQIPDLDEYLLDDFFTESHYEAEYQTSSQEESVRYEGVTCQDCDQEIPARRLQVIPSATRCVVCQQIAESK